MEKSISLKHCTGSCQCGAVRYEATIDLAKGTFRCNCSICKKARAWFTFAGGKDFRLLEGEDAMSSCATGDAEFMGGRFYAVAVSTFDNVTTDELAAAPLKFNDNLHDRFDRAPADTRLM